MDPGFRDTGAAYASNTRGAPRIYWVQDFGTTAQLRGWRTKRR
jgi:uncharacterized protein YkwD